MTRVNLALLALLVAAGCSGSDATAPSTTSLRTGAGPAMDQSSAEPRMIAVPYEKWITSYPAMAGNADGVRGAFTGTILQRSVSADGKIIHLRAQYVIDNTHRKGHSFTTVIEGDESLWTNTAVLSGVVTAGWKVGAPVLVHFDVLSPCTVATAPVGTRTCFKGTIYIERGSNDDSTDDSDDEARQ
jgi:hypothetical protein